MGSHPGKSAGVNRRRMGYPEIVVNSDWRSGLFSSVGRSVFSSQARSFAEGSRGAAETSPVVMVVVVPLTLSLMADAPDTARSYTKLKRTRNSMLCESEKRGKGTGLRRGAEDSREKNEAGEGCSPSPASLQKLPFASSIAQTLEELVCTDDLTMERAKDQRFEYDFARLSIGD